jgi:hypothetical protein
MEKFRTSICTIVFIFILLTIASPGHSLTIEPENVVVENEAISPGQVLQLFSGLVKADTTVNNDLNFSFEIRVPEDSERAATLDDFEKAVLVHDNDVIDEDSLTTADFTLSDTTNPDLSNKNPYDYSVRIIADTNPSHDKEFSVNFTTVEVEGKDNSVEGNQTPTITITNLVESYNRTTDNDAIPFVLGAQSRSIPLVHMMFAGQNPGDTLFFDNLSFTLRELIGEVIPGGGPFDQYGDFKSFKLMRSSEPEFGEGTMTTLAVIKREDLPSDAKTGTPEDTYVISFHDQATGWRASKEDFFTETTDNAHYYITLQTNIGWGNASAEPADNAQFFGYGEAWDAFIKDTDAITLTNTVTKEQMIGDTIDVTGGPIYHSVTNLRATSSGQIDKFFGDPDQKINNTKGLDYLPDQMFSFIALGPSDTEPIEQTRLEAITIKFSETSPGFEPEEDLRKLTSNMKSGISVWFNEAPYDAQSHGDQLLELSDDSKWFPSQDKVKIVINNGFELRPPQDSIKSPDPDLETNRGMMDRGVSKTARSTFFVNFLTAESANHGDTFKATIPPGGLHFSEGNSTDSTDTPGYSTAPGLPIEFASDTTGRIKQAVEVFFSRLTDTGQMVGAPSGQIPVIGLNIEDNGSGDGTNSLLEQLDLVLDDGTTNFSANELNALANADTSGVAIYRDNDDHPNNNSGQFDPGIDVRIPLNLAKSTKEGRTGEADDDPFVRLFVDHSASTEALIPDNDQSDSEGDDYFITVHTSSDGVNGNTFRPAIGNRAIQDGIRPVVEFVEKGNLGNSVSAIFSKGDLAESDRFFAHPITINTVHVSSIDDLTKPAQRISVDAPPLPVLGMNLADGEKGDQTLKRVDATVHFSSTSDTTDFAKLTSSPQSGVSLYRDNGDGTFDRAQDEHVDVIAPSWKMYDDTAQVKLVPSTAQPIPNSSNQTNDFFLTVRSSRSMEFGDTFSVEIQGGDMIFSSEQSGPDKQEQTNTITAGLPLIFSDQGSPPTHTLNEETAPVDILGLNTADTGTGQFLDQVKILFEDTGANDFLLSNDLMEVTSDSMSGVSIWRDANDNDRFDPASDTHLTPTNLAVGVDNVTLGFSGSNSDTALPDQLDGKDDFFFIIRPSTSISQGNDFVLTVPKQGVKTQTNIGNHFRYTSRTIVSNINNFDNTPPDVLTITNPSGGETFFKSRDDTLAISVQAEDNVTDDTTAVGSVTVLLDGTAFTADQVSKHEWEQVINLSSLSEGNHTVSARATDVHGNETGPISPITFQLSTTTNVTPTITRLSPSDTQLTDRTISVRVKANNQNEVEIRLAEDENVTDTPANYNVVTRQGPDNPGGNTFTFRDIEVSLSAKAIALVAQGFSAGGASNFSDTVPYSRNNILGTDLFNRPAVDVSLAEALAAEKNFGIVVFGNKGSGSSSTNPGSPRFDPTMGETLKIIPPSDAQATMKVFTMEDRLVFKQTGMTGQEVEWGGRDLSGSVVNNGVYIVVIKSGGKTKSFPVAVAK